ncbi:uncharacterized protein J3D65DRAFT_603016 [Phyllosticta citribraziliensis]|uniref:Uncharacterized protein n=1 Tax=Phyllosticta citribraziliensis TaxID=989973 RepID=A0ABR1LP62_9PEZI
MAVEWAASVSDWGVLEMGLKPMAMDWERDGCNSVSRKWKERKGKEEGGERGMSYRLDWRSVEEEEYKRVFGSRWLGLEAGKQATQFAIAGTDDISTAFFITSRSRNEAAFAIMRFSNTLLLTLASASVAVTGLPTAAASSLPGDVATQQHHPDSNDHKHPGDPPKEHHHADQPPAAAALAARDEEHKKKPKPKPHGAPKPGAPKPSGKPPVEARGEEHEKPEGHESKKPEPKGPKPTDKPHGKPHGKPPVEARDEEHKKPKPKPEDLKPKGPKPTEKPHGKPPVEARDEEHKKPEGHESKKPEPKGPKPTGKPDHKEPPKSKGPKPTGKPPVEARGDEHHKKPEGPKPTGKPDHKDPPKPKDPKPTGKPKQPPADE